MSRRPRDGGGPGPQLSPLWARLNPGQKARPPNCNFLQFMAAGLQGGLGEEALSALRPQPRPGGPSQLGTAGPRPRRPPTSPGKAHRLWTLPPPAPGLLRPPRGLLTPLPPWSQPGATDSPGPRTSRNVSVFISLHGVSTIRAASRTPSVALVKHWARKPEALTGDPGPGRKCCPALSVPVGTTGTPAAPRGGFGAADVIEGWGGEERVTLPALAPQCL